MSGVGIFALYPAGAPVSDEILNNPDTTGIVIRQQWSEIAATSDSRANDYSFISSEVARAAAAGKQVSLIVSWAGKATPQWVIDRGARSYTYSNPNPFQPDFGQAVTVPASWDRGYVSEVVNFVTNLGAALGSSSALRIVNTHCVSASTPDWFLPINSPENIQLLKDSGYTNDAMLSACRDIVDAVMRAFPNQIVTMAIGQLPQSLTGMSEGDFLAREIVRHIATTWPNRKFYLMRWNLNTVVPDPRVTADLGGWTIMNDQRTNTTDRILAAAQWVWPASDTTTCRANGNRTPCDVVTNLAVPGDIGIGGYGMRYLEVYGADVSNPLLVSSLHKLAGAIGK